MKSTRTRIWASGLVLILNSTCFVEQVTVLVGAKGRYQLSMGIPTN